MSVSEDRKRNRAVAARVKMAREAAGLSHAELADRLGIARQGVVSYERAGIGTLRGIARAARALRVSEPWLAYGEGYGPKVAS